MNITIKNHGQETLVLLEGRLDTNTSPELEKKIAELFDKGVKVITFDFNDLEYISSAGLRVLLSTQKQINNMVGEMKIVNISNDIREIFNMTGFNDFLTLE